MSEYKPLVAFEDASQSYVNGFEAGMVWREMELAVQDHELVPGDLVFLERTVHSENSVTLRRMADALGWRYSEEPAAEGYLFVRMEYVHRGPAPKLKLVR